MSRTHTGTVQRLWYQQGVRVGHSTGLPQDSGHTKGEKWTQVGNVWAAGK